MKFPCDWESRHSAGVSKGLENLALHPGLWQRRMNLFLGNVGLFFDIAQFCHIFPCFYWCIFKLFSPCCLTYCPELLGIQCYANSLLLLLLGKLQDTALNYSSPFLSSAYRSPWNYPPFQKNTNLPYRVFAYNQYFPADGLCEHSRDALQNGSHGKKGMLSHKIAATANMAKHKISIYQETNYSGYSLLALTTPAYFCLFSE